MRDEHLAPDGAVAWAIKLGDGSISPFGWNGMPMLEGMKRMVKLVDGAEYVYAYTTPPAAQVQLVADMQNALPGGGVDASTFQQIEEALDRAQAPMQDDGGKWLTLPERIAALATHPTGDALGAVCKWWQQDEGYDTFSTGCGREFTVNDAEDGNPDLPFCPYCAKRVEGHAWHSDDDAALRPSGGEGKGVDRG